MTKSIINRSLLQALTSNDVDDLIIEEELIAKKFQFTYSIDPDDIKNYCYPFGLTKSEFDPDKKPLEIVTDEQISYYNLINKQKSKLLLMENYLDEIQKLKSIIQYANDSSIELINSFEALVQLYENNESSFDAFQKITQISKREVSLLLSIAIGSLFQGMECLNKIEKDRLLHGNKELESSSLPQFVVDAIITSSESTLPDELYSELRKTFPDSIEIKRKISRYIDCQAFGYLLSANQMIINNKKKNLLLFLSSVKSSRTIINIAKDKMILPEIDGKLFNPHRWIGQIYLKLLCKDNGNTIDNLKKMKEIIKLKEKTNIINPEQLNAYITEKFENRLSTLREYYEKEALISKYKKFNSEIDEVLNKKTLSNYKDIVNLIKRLLKLSKKEKSLQGIIDTTLMNIKYERNFRSTLLYGIKSILDSQSYLAASPGKDKVHDVHHQLPIVFYIDNQIFKENINQIINFYLEIEPKNRNSKRLIKTIEDSVKFIFESTNEDEVKLIRYLLLVILPKFKHNDPEQQALQRVKTILEKENPSIRSEFLYVASWSARRLLDYNGALSYAKEGLKINDKDPRLYHSLCLIYYDLYKEENRFTLLEQSIFNCNRAIELYSKYDSEELGIKNSKIALYNSHCYLLCLQFNNSPKKENNKLIEARKYLELLKYNEQKYYSYAEFQATEAYLELLEFDAFNSPHKIHRAKAAIKRAVSIDPRDEHNELLKLIESRLSN